MNMTRAFRIGLNPYPAFVAVKSKGLTTAGYARQILREDHRSSQVRHPNLLLIRDDDFIEQCIPSQHSLAHESADAVLSALPEEAAARLKQQRDQLLKRYSEELPLLPGETLESLSLAVMTAPYLVFPSGSLLVLRSSNLADVQFIMPWIRVDRRHGIPVFQGLTDQAIDPDALASSALRVVVDSLAVRSESFARFQATPFASDSENAAKLEQLGASLWDYISQIGGCVIWVAPAPWNAIGAGTITALRLFFADSSGSGQTLLANIYDSVNKLVGSVKLAEEMTVFSVYSDKLLEIQGLMAQWRDTKDKGKDLPLSNSLIDDQNWLGDGFGGLNYQLTQLKRATEQIRSSTELLDPDETLGYHSAYVMGVLFQVQCSGMIAKMRAQYASNIGQCQPEDLDVDKWSSQPGALPLINNVSSFLEATEKFQQAYIKFKDLCVGYVDSSGQLHPGRYQEVSRLVHDVWYKKVRAVTGVIPYTVSNMYNEVWWRYGAWLDVNEQFNDHADADLTISAEQSLRVHDLFNQWKSKSDADFWTALIRFQRDDPGRLGYRELIAFCVLVKSQRGYEAEKWPIYSELELILQRLGWEDPAHCHGNNPIGAAVSWISQFTKADPWIPPVPGAVEPIWWEGPASVDDDKKTPQPLCREVAAEILELFLVRQYRTFNVDYHVKPLALEKHRIESDRTVHNICCTDQYEVSFVDHFDRVIADRDRAIADYLSAFNLPHMVDTARQIHASVYSASSLMAPMPPADHPVCSAMGKPPASDAWKDGNKVWYCYSYRNSAGPSSASPEVGVPIAATSGMQLTLELDPLGEATQYLVYRKITDINGALIRDYAPIGGGKIAPGMQGPLVYRDHR